MSKGQWGANVDQGSWNQPDVKGETHTNIALRQTIVAGAAAGDITVTGIEVGDKLVSVLDIAGVDLTSEFTVTAADTINNDGGTSSAASFVIVTYLK